MAKKKDLPMDVMVGLHEAGGRCQFQWHHRSPSDSTRRIAQYRRRLGKAIATLERLDWIDDFFPRVSKDNVGQLRPIEDIIHHLECKDEGLESQEDYKIESAGEPPPHRREELRPLMDALEKFQGQGVQAMTMCKYCEAAILPQLIQADGMRPGDLYERLRKRPVRKRKKAVRKK
jgi:hypothetical protein